MATNTLDKVTPNIEPDRWKKIKQSLRFNKSALLDSIRLMAEMGLLLKNIKIKKITEEQMYLVATYNATSLVREVLNRDKFLGMIILDEKEECYEIADGQQRLTTMLLSLISIYNHYQGSRKEQSVLNNYIFDKEMNIRLQNDSVGSYISSDNGSGLLEVDIEDDKDVYNQKNVFKTAYATIDAILSENDRFKEFKDKLQNSTLLVLIKDIDSTNSDAVEQIFLDINEKSKRLDNASIFKGYCFKIYDEAFQDELKCLWIR